MLISTRVCACENTHLDKYTDRQTYRHTDITIKTGRIHDIGDIRGSIALDTWDPHWEPTRGLHWEPVWAQRGTHLGPIWVRPRVPFVKTCCTWHVGPSRAAQMGPSWTAHVCSMWDKSGPGLAHEVTRRNPLHLTRGSLMGSPRGALVDSLVGPHVRPIWARRWLSLEGPLRKPVSLDTWGPHGKPAWGPRGSH